MQGKMFSHLKKFFNWEQSILSVFINAMKLVVQINLN